MSEQSQMRARSATTTNRAKQVSTTIYHRSVEVARNLLLLSNELVDGIAMLEVMAMGTFVFRILLGHHPELRPSIASVFCCLPSKIV
jgi:hypothetical protein